MEHLVIRLLRTSAHAAAAVRACRYYKTSPSTMLTLVILLVFSSKLVSSVTQTVRFNIEVTQGVTFCTSQEVDLMEGDNVNIETKVPRRVMFMWCNNRLGRQPISTVFYDPSKQLLHANTANLNSISLSSSWTCEYLMELDYAIHTTTFRDGTTYNYAQCILQIKVHETFRYSGLDPSRLTTRTRADQTDYSYTYYIGEHLSIGCEHDARRNITFKVYNSTSNIYSSINKSRFESQGTRDLSSSNLICYYKDDTYGQIHAINLYLQARTPTFSGLDPARLSTSSNGDQHYSFKAGELLSIGCETSGNDAKTFQFCNSTSRECSIIPSFRKFDLQATTELNNSFLLCNIPGDHIRLFLDNHEVLQTLPRDPGALVFPLQPDTFTARTAQATTTAVSSAVSRHKNPRSDADKIRFTGFPRDLIVTKTYLAATDYVYKYKNNEELNVTCTADPGDGRIIFQFGYANDPPQRIESFVYKVTLAINGSTLLCVLQDNNGMNMNVYTKRVTLLFDAAEPPMTTPTTVRTTTVTSRVARVITRNPATTPRATNRPIIITTKRPNPPRKTSARKPGTTRATLKPRAPTTTTTPKTTTTTIKPTSTITSSPLDQLTNVNIGRGNAVVDINGTDLILVNDTIKYKKEYRYNFNKEEDLNLTCTVSGVIGNYSIILETEHQKGILKPFTFVRNAGMRHSVSYQFPLTSKSRTISCTAKDLRTNSAKFKSTVYLHYEPNTTAAPSTTNTDTVKPAGASTSESTTEPAKSQSQDGTIPWKLIAIGAAAFVTLFVVIAALAAHYLQKKPQPTDSDYANLTNDSQHDYQSMPVPVPAPKKPVPTVQGTYSEPKDSNDMSEALYADPNVFRAVKSEETYAEPYNPNNELYTTPIPKSQRGNKLKDDPNYSNVFGKDYVNSKPK